MNISIELILVLLGGVVGWTATVVGLNQSWVGEPLWGPLHRLMNWMHDTTNPKKARRLVVLKRWIHLGVFPRLSRVVKRLRIDPGTGSIAAQKGVGLRKRQNWTFALSSAAFVLAASGFLIGR